MQCFPDMAIAATESKQTRRALRCGASALAMSMMIGATPALAQTTPAADTSADTIVVTGYRASLESAQKRKKNSDTIVDSVTADDIGALPDRSVTETLQRIPGISINRFAAGVDPDHFTAEGSGVVVRGLTYVRSEFNGRDAFTANNGRGLGFADVPSELLGGVDVFKSLPADHIEGGIAGTVDLKTRKPFDSKSGFITATLETNYGDFIRKSAPSGAIVASKRWDTSIGEIGVLGSISYSQLFTRADRIALSHFKPIPLDASGKQIIPLGAAVPARYGLIPSGAVAGSQEFDRERIGASAALQWRSPSGALEATFEFLRSDAKQTWSEHTLEVATDNVDSQGGAFAAPGTNFTFDSSGVFTNGVITGDTGWRADSTNNGGSTRTPAFGLQSNNIKRGHRESNVNDDYSANLKWKISDHLTAVFDYQHVTSKVRVDDNTLWASTYQNAQIVNNGFNLPSVTLLPVQNCNPNCSINPNNGNYTGDATQTYFTGTHQSYLDPYNSFWRAAMDHTERSDGFENAAKVDLKYDLGEDSFLNSVKIGYRYANRDQTARFSTYNWGVLSEQWGGNPGGPVWLDNPVSQQKPGYEVYAFPNFFGGAVASPAGDGRLYFAGDPIKDYAAYSAYALAINKAWGGGGWVPLASRNGVVAGTPFLPGEINAATERNNAGYIMANFGKDFGDGKRFSGNIGVRYSKTERTSFGGAFSGSGGNTYGTRLAACAPVVGQPPNTDPFCRLAPAIQNALVASDTGLALTSVPATRKLTYDYWLPSVNVKLELGNGLQFRAAYFKGVAPPDFGLTRNYVRVDPIQVQSSPLVNGGAPYLTQSTIAGNPFLKPTESDNFDVTGEYYFGNGGQFTVSLFYKELHGVITSSTTSRTLAVGTGTVSVADTLPLNSTKTGKIKGFELSYQQNYTFLPGVLSGLGLQANYTYVDSSGVPQSTLSSTDPDVGAGRVSNIPGDGFPLQGLSKHSFNIVPYYQKGPFTLRAAYSWRSQYLLTLRDVITPFDPIFQRAYGQLDGSVSLKVGKHLTLGLDGANLLNSIVVTSAAVYDRPATDPNKKILLVPRQWYKTDRRFTFSAKLSF